MKLQDTVLYLLNTEGFYLELYSSEAIHRDPEKCHDECIRQAFKDAMSDFWPI